MLNLWSITLSLYSYCVWNFDLTNITYNKICGEFVVYNNKTGSRGIKDTVVISGRHIIRLQPLLILMNRPCKMSIFETDQMDWLYKFEQAAYFNCSCFVRHITEQRECWDHWGEGCSNRVISYGTCSLDNAMWAWTLCTVSTEYTHISVL